MRVGELFSGIGGFGLGAQRAGHSIAWACEIDDFASRVYAARFPGVPIHPDVRDFGGAPVDCITGGFPCQDLSVAGKRKGLTGERSGLFWEIVRIAGRLRPRWLFLENVPGLRSSPTGRQRGRDLAIALAALDELGYGVAWASLDAQFFGLAQERERVFIVGHLGAPCPPEILFEPPSVSGDSPPSREAGAEAAHDVAACLNSGGNNGGFRTEPGEHVVVHALTAEGHDASEDGTGRGRPIVARTLRVGGRDQGAGSSYDNTPVVYAIGSHAGTADGQVTNQSHASGGPVGINIREELAYSLLGGRRQGIVEARPRYLTPRECERLQGFPDDWTLIPGASDSARYRALGNAVAVPVVEWILRRMTAFSAPSPHTPTPEPQ